MEAVAAKPIQWMDVSIKTPPFNEDARKRVGELLREVQNGAFVPMPNSRPMSSIATGTHELRVNDGDVIWRVLYYIGRHRIAVLYAFEKKTQTTPDIVIKTCKSKVVEFLRHFDNPPEPEGEE